MVWLRTLILVAALLPLHKIAGAWAADDAVGLREIYLEWMGSEALTATEVSPAVVKLADAELLVSRPLFNDAFRNPVDLIYAREVLPRGSIDPAFLRNLCDLNSHICQPDRAGSRCPSGLCWSLQTMPRTVTGKSGNVPPEVVQRGIAACRGAERRTNLAGDIWRELTDRRPHWMLCAPDMRAEAYRTDEGLSFRLDLSRYDPIELAIALGGCDRGGADSRQQCMTKLDGINDRGDISRALASQSQKMLLFLPVRRTILRIRTHDEKAAQEILDAHRQRLPSGRIDSPGSRFQFWGEAHGEPLQVPIGESANRNWSCTQDMKFCSANQSYLKQMGLPLNEMRANITGLKDKLQQVPIAVLDEFIWPGYKHCAIARVEYPLQCSDRSCDQPESSRDQGRGSQPDRRGQSAVLDAGTAPGSQQDQSSGGPPLVGTPPSGRQISSVSCNLDDVQPYQKGEDRRHGMIMAGLIGGLYEANPSVAFGPSGGAPFAFVRASNINDPQGEFAKDVQDVTSPPESARFLPPKVFNISYAFPEDSRAIFNRTFFRSSQDAVKMALIAAAGNDGHPVETKKDCVTYPACFSSQEPPTNHVIAWPRVVSVAALDANGTKVLQNATRVMSNYGSAIDVAAVGIGIGPANDRETDDQFYKTSGTSVAAAYVSGLASLLEAKYRRAFERPSDVAENSSDVCSFTDVTRPILTKPGYWIRARIVATADLVKPDGTPVVEPTTHDGKSYVVSQFGRVNFARALKADSDLIRREGGDSDIETVVTWREKYGLEVKSGTVTSRHWRQSECTNNDCDSDWLQGLRRNLSDRNWRMELRHVLRLQRTKQGTATEEPQFRVVFLDPESGYIAQIQNAVIALNYKQNRQWNDARVFPSKEQIGWDDLADFTSKMMVFPCDMWAQS